MIKACHKLNYGLRSHEPVWPANKHDKHGRKCLKGVESFKFDRCDKHVNWKTHTKKNLMYHLAQSIDFKDLELDEELQLGSL